MKTKISTILIILVVVIFSSAMASFAYNRYFSDKKQSSVGVMNETNDTTDYFEIEKERLETEGDPNEDDTESIVPQPTQEVVSKAIVKQLGDLKITLGDYQGEKIDESYVYFGLDIDGPDEKYALFYSSDYGGVACAFDSANISARDFVRGWFEPEDYYKYNIFATNGTDTFDASTLYWVDDLAGEDDAHVWLYIFGVESEKFYGIFEVTIQRGDEQLIKDITMTSINDAPDMLNNTIIDTLKDLVDVSGGLTNCYYNRTKTFMTNWYAEDDEYRLRSIDEIRNGNSDMLECVVTVKNTGDIFNAYLEPGSYRMICFKIIRVSDFIYKEELPISE